MARPDLLITEYRFLIHHMEKDLIITEYRFLIHSMQTGIRKLQ
jgi:hypothetical protein